MVEISWTHCSTLVLVCTSIMVCETSGSIAHLSLDAVGLFRGHSVDQGQRRQLYRDIVGSTVSRHSSRRRGIPNTPTRIHQGFTAFPLSTKLIFVMKSNIGHDHYSLIVGGFVQIGPGVPNRGFLGYEWYAAYDSTAHRAFVTVEKRKDWVVWRPAAEHLVLTYWGPTNWSCADIDRYSKSSPHEFRSY